MRKNMTTWLILVSLFIGELHSMSYFPDDEKRAENWIIKEYKPMTPKWNMQFLEAQILVPLYFFAFICWRPTKVNRTTIRAMAYMGVVDTFLYFYNFKNPLFFGSFYVWLFAMWILVYYWRSEKGFLIKHLLPKRTKNE